MRDEFYEHLGDEVYQLTLQTFLQFAPNRAEEIYDEDFYDDEEEDLDFDDIFTMIKRRIRVSHRSDEDILDFYESELHEAVGKEIVSKEELDDMIEDEDYDEIEKVVRLSLAYDFLGDMMSSHEPLL